MVSRHRKRRHWASILIVQKRWTLARDLALAFESKGARVLSVRDAAAGLKLADDPDVAAAVLDSDSPKLCRLLDAKDIPYVVYTGRALDEECAAGILIRKPASAEEVVASVERLLGLGQGSVP
jgi:DNA-binding response OmpR family regulator